MSGKGGPYAEGSIKWRQYVVARKMGDVLIATIPKEIVARAGLSPGDRLLVELTTRGVVRYRKDPCTRDDKSTRSETTDASPIDSESSSSG